MTDEQAREELVPGNDPYALPSEPRVLPVTPEMASSWLSYRGGHPKMRRLNKRTTGRYQRLMETGRWRQATPEGMIFDTEGWGISFQHRAKALANVAPETLTREYGNPWLEFWIFPNQPREIAPYLEAGRRRSAADSLRMKYGTQVAAGARHLAALTDGDRWGMPRYGDVTVPEVVEVHEQWPELDWHTTELFAVQLETGVPMGPHAAVVAQAERTEHRDKIQPWLAGLKTGYNLSEGDPRAQLRRRFHRGLQTLTSMNRRDYTYALIAKAWNAYVHDTPLTVLRHVVSEPFPTVEGFTFNGKENAA